MLRSINNLIEFSYLKISDCDTMDLNMEAKELLSFIMYSSNLSVIYNRKYIKVPDIIGAVGGLMKVFYLFFKLVNKQFDNISYYEKVISKIYYCEDNELLKINEYSKTNYHNKSTINNINSSLNKSLTKFNNLLNGYDASESIEKLTRQNKNLNLKFSFCCKLKIIMTSLCSNRYSDTFRTNIKLFDRCEAQSKELFQFYYNNSKFEE
jgi:hypothetical protein